MQETKREIDAVYNQYRNNYIIEDDVLFNMMLRSEKIDSTILEFDVVIRGVIQENIGRLSNDEIEEVTQYANNVMDNFRRILKREN
ncbi:hypothetical protein [Flavobacterium microcysteis]|uniref:Uncharacterized protein n=1 Tax=Flavobacterium microcysteis TaxID=2596891 RepID=A0A501QGA0_9FLAO|nr:hypothetical protein [Flavobacterium microcysteis]TPD71117.1 hypothetical protein FJA49_04245 [Flavobacterium microcysteis]